MITSKTNIKYKVDDDYTVTIADIESSKDLITAFQREFFSRYDLKFDLLSHISSHKKWQEIFDDEYEDCFRLLPYKINANDLACVVDFKGMPVHVSFCKNIENYLRVCIGYNTLKEHRHKIPVTAWRKDWGYFNHLMNLPVDGHFVTYHNRTSRISAESRLLKQNKNRSGLLGMPKSHLSDFKVFSEDQIFYGVPQTIAFRHSSGTTTEKNYKEMLSKIL